LCKVGESDNNSWPLVVIPKRLETFEGEGEGEGRNKTIGKGKKKKLKLY
jgi:hypothetical protein